MWRMTDSESAAPSPKRPYKEAAAGHKDGVPTVLIDGRQLRTPGRNAFALPSDALAQACAAEWNAQGDIVRPETMPMTRIANVAIDQTPRARYRIIENIAGYALTDLVSHRAADPESLVRRQAVAWDPLVEWAATDLGANLLVVTGVIAAEQPRDAYDAFERAAGGYDDYWLTGLAHAVGVAGSGVIGFALAKKRLTVQEAFEASMLDDIWQIETWGEDFAARERLKNLRGEFDAVGNWFAALGEPTPPVKPRVDVWENPFKDAP
jgi:chaperone required for assembly of F1-ATPase